MQPYSFPRVRARLRDVAVLLACLMATHAQSQEVPVPEPVPYFVANGAASNAAGAYAEGEEALAAGEGASAVGEAAMALGAGAGALSERGIAIGRNALTRGSQSVSLGADARANGSYAIALGSGTRVEGLQAMAFGLRSEVAGVAAIGIGGYSRASGRLSTVLGYGGQSDAEYALALGSFSRASGRRSVALGAGAVAERDRTVSVGSAGAERQVVNVAAGERDTDATNVAQLRQATEAFSAAGEGVALATGAAATAAGRNSAASGERSVALGVEAVAGARDSVAIGAGSKALEAEVVSVGSGDGVGGPAARRLVNVAAGGVGAGSREAVNGGQLFDAMTHTLGVIDRRFSEAATQLTAHAIGVGASAATQDAVALGRHAQAQASASTALGAGARVEAQATGAVALGEGAVADRPNTVSVGRTDAERQVTHVAAGTQATDAVNKSQLDDGVARATRYTDAHYTTLADAFADYRSDIDDRFRQQDRRIDRQGAMNAAMLNMATSAAGIRTDNRLGVGVGFQRGASALSIGYQRAFGERATVTLGGAFGGGESALGVGAGLGW